MEIKTSDGTVYELTKPYYISEEVVRDFLRAAANNISGSLQIFAFRRPLDERGGELKPAFVAVGRIVAGSIQYNLEKGILYFLTDEGAYQIFSDDMTHEQLAELIEHWIYKQGVICSQNGRTQVIKTCDIDSKDSSAIEQLADQLTNSLSFEATATAAA